MKTHLRYITDFDVNSGVSEDLVNYYTFHPGLLAEAGEYVYKDVSDMSNFGLSTWVNFTDITDGNLRILLGVTGAGVGKAIDFNFASASRTISLVNISTFTGSADSTIVSKEFYPRLLMQNNYWANLQIIIANNIVKVYYDNYFVFESTVYSASGTNIGLARSTGTAAVYMSDTYWYQNQVFWGNVNINGAPDDEGVVVLFNQHDAEVLDYQPCNADGNYVLLLEDDPEDLNKYFMIGFVRDAPHIQPRGVCNITL